MNHRSAGYMLAGACRPSLHLADSHAYTRRCVDGQAYGLLHPSIVLAFHTPLSTSLLPARNQSGKKENSSQHQSSPPLVIPSVNFCPRHSAERHSWLAASHEARVQAGRSDCVLVGHPGQEALESETIAAVRRGPVPVNLLASYLVGPADKRTFFGPCTSNSPWTGCLACRRPP